ncbi:filamentous hemagglutinin N-terminal domain-containing protein [Verrucomicrobiaceae bacterium 227]
MNYRLVPKLSLSYLAATLAPLMANPIDPTPTVVTGQVEFAGLDTHNAVITQGTQKAIVDYTHFNIPEGSSVQFIQPNAESALLNRISGADPSVLNGSLTANGQIYFVNPAGVTFGKNSVIRADVFMAAAGQISNSDFLNNIQNFTLSGNIVNHGSIQTENGVGLFGQQVENTGEIVSKNGYAIVASGDEVHVRQGGTSLAVDVTDSAKASKEGTGVRNLGTVDGEDVMFSAGDAFATAIQQSGKVNARRSAKIQSDGGNVEVSGEVTARNEAGQGGRIEVGGTDQGADTAPSSANTKIAESAVLDASSDSGKGGHIVVWSDGHTDFSGTADATSRSGEGGFIEASGKTINFLSIGDSILLGAGGQFLLDPTDVVIDSAMASGFEGMLDGGTNVDVTTASGGGDDGDITVIANIQVPINNAGRQGVLTLTADRDIIVDGGVVIQNLQEDFAPGETVFNFQAGRNMTLNGEVRHSGTNGETGRGSILLTAGGDLLVNNVTVDSNGGSLIVDANQVTLDGLSGNFSAGLIGESTANIDITAPSGVTFNGGNIQSYGGADIFIDTGLLLNNTGATAIARDTLSESFYAIRLPNPSDNGAGSNHIYNGIQSGARALFNVSDLDPVKIAGISGNRYYYNMQPTVNVRALDGAKVYGNTFNLLTGGPAVSVDTGSFVPVPLGNPFLQDTTANTLNLTGVATSSTGAVVTANVGDYAITPGGATSNNGYAFNYLNGNLVVDRRDVTLSANNQSKQYGDILTLSDTAFDVIDLNGGSILPNGNEIDTVVVNSATGIDSSPDAGATTYPDEIQISGQAGSGGFDAANYRFTYVDSDLVVNRRNVTVTASEQSKFYGDVLDLTSVASQKSFTILDNGLTAGGDDILPNGEMIDTVSLQSVLPVNSAASVTDDVGTYLNELRVTGVTGSGSFDVNNYNLTLVDGNLVIVPRPITLTPGDQTKQYGEILPLGTTAFTILDNGLTNGGDAALPNAELINTVALVSSSGIAASTDADASGYADNISVDSNLFGSANGSNGFKASNYDITFTTGDLTIIPRQIELIASRQEKFYGDGLTLDDTAFTIVDQGNALDSALPNGEVVTNVTINSATGVDLSSTSDASLYSNEIDISSPVVGTPGTGDGFLESNYDITFTSGDLLVKPRPITVSAVQQEKIYGNTLTLDPTAFTVTDLDGDALLPNSESIDTVNVISRGGHDASTTSSALTYGDDLEITSVANSSNGFDLGNYSIDFSNLADFVINRRAVTLTALQQEKDYGDIHTLDTTVFSVTDLDNDSLLPNGELIDTVTIVSANGIDASTDADVASYGDNLSITPTTTGTPTLAGSNGFDQENYLFSYGTGDFVINRRAITLTAGQQDKIYGNILGLDDTAFTTLDKDGDAALPNGEIVTNVTINSVTGVDASTTSNVGTYDDEIAISGPVTGTPGTGDGFLESNYDITYVAGDLVVNKRAITVAAVQQEKIYGNTLTLDPTAFTVTDLDGDALLPNSESIDTVNVISRGGHDASTTSSALTYGDDLEITSVANSSNGFDLGNYSIDFSNLADFVINRRAVTLTALQQEKDYGDIHTLDTTVFSVTDLDNDSLLPNGELIDTVTIVSANGIDASTDADVATYGDNLSITPTTTGTPTLAGSNGFDQENYLFSYETGDFIINRRAITLTASQQDKIYGNILDLNDTAFTTLDKNGGAALPNGEVVTNVTINSATFINAATTADVGTYTDEIVISGPVAGTPGTGDGFLESNYDITYVAGDLVVNRRPITVSAVQQDKIYGNTLTLDSTAFTVTDLDGDALLPNTESIDTVNVISRGGHDASTTSSAQTYIDDLEVTSVATSSLGFDLANYDIDFSNLADFVINRRAVTLTALQQEKDYGDIHTLDTTVFSVTDLDNDSLLPNGELIDTVTIVSANGIDASTDADVASYGDNLSITPTTTGTPTLAGSNGFDQENYLFSYGTGDFVINRRAITLTAGQQDKIYGNILGLDDTAFTTLDKDGDAALPNGEIVTNVTINSVTGVDASTTTNVGTYDDEIAISGPVAGTPGTGDGFLESNYDITYVAGDLVVSKRAITLTALPQGKTYGEIETPSTSDFAVVDLDNDASLPNGESIDSVTITSSVSVDSNANAGVYTDDLAPTNILTSSNGFDEGNYDITRINGNYTIDRRAILLTAQDQGKIYGDTLTLDDTAFTVSDTFGGGGSSLPNGEIVNTVSFDPTSLPGDTTASAGNYLDELSVSDQVGSNGFLASNYDISYATGDFSIARRSVQLVINDDKRYAGAAYQIDPTAFVTIDLDGDAFLPNGESIDSLVITSLTGVAENPASPMGIYPDELTAEALTAAGSNGFDHGNYSITVTPGQFEIEPFPGLAAIGQDIYIERWILDNVGYDPVDPFANSYAISQSVGVRILSLNSWAGLSASKKQEVLAALDAIPLHLQTLDHAQRLIEKVK